MFSCAQFSVSFRFSSPCLFKLIVISCCFHPDELLHLALKSLDVIEELNFEVIYIAIINTASTQNSTKTCVYTRHCHVYTSFLEVQ
jgi:hypothetical protein